MHAAPTNGVYTSGMILAVSARATEKKRVGSVYSIESRNSYLARGSTHPSSRERLR